VVGEVVFIEGCKVRMNHFATFPTIAEFGLRMACWEESFEEREEG